MKENTILHKTIRVNGVEMFYREAGNKENPAIVLLHGFPTSSHMYRKVLASLADAYYLIAPDYPGFGYSEFPDPETFEYSFANLANYTNLFLEQLEVKKYSLMIQDYGSPVGFRIATAHPERVQSLIIQNGNAYEEGLGDGWGGIRELWKDRTPENEAALLEIFSLESLKWQYTHGTRNPETVDPDCWNLDFYRLSRPGAHKANLDLFYDYQNNVALYPEWQKYLRTYQPPALITWGKNDLFFPEPGAEAYKKDLKNVDYHIYDTGHFALEEDGASIIENIRTFMSRL